MFQKPGRKLIGMCIIVTIAGAPGSPAAGADRDDARRMVLVELYTSQGCDMCPEAEEILGRLAARERRIVPIAFHVDYFNKPWKDVFSDPLYSQRQQVYNQVYTRPKPEEYGLYYTPMMMIDGSQSVNGRDPDSAITAIRAALGKKPAVAIDLSLDLAKDGRSGKATIQVSSRSPRVEKTPLLVCAVLREDGVVTDIPSGENAGKSLVARFPARQTKFDFIELEGNKPTSRAFDFSIEPDWNPKKLALAAFVQDKRTAAVHQAIEVPWQSATPPSSTDKKPLVPRRGSQAR